MLAFILLLLFFSKDQNTTKLKKNKFNNCGFFKVHDFASGGHCDYWLLAQEFLVNATDVHT
jgi:hypothetical protein